MGGAMGGAILQQGVIVLLWLVFDLYVLCNRLYNFRLSCRTDMTPKMVV